MTLSADEHRSYIRIADELRRQIADGRLPAGQQMPSIKKLCLETDSSRQTVGRSLQLLNREGLTIRIPGRGYYVCAQPDEPQGDTVSSPLTQPASMLIGELAGVLTAEQSNAVSLPVRELVKGNPLAIAWLDLADAMLKARCPQCAGPMIA
jgi:DNA-binding transcriptional MocR family regulator